MNIVTRKRKFKIERNYVYTYSPTGAKYLVRRRRNTNNNYRLPIIEQKVSLFRKLLRYFTKICYNQ